MQVDQMVTLPKELETVSLETGAEAVRRYAELTTDFNPIHVDPEFAAGTKFGAPIAHGTMSLNLIVQAIERTFGTMPAGLTIEVRFVRPVKVGATIRAGGTLQSAAPGTYGIFVETQEGERAIEGICVLPPHERAS